MKNGCACDATAAIIILVIAALIGVGWYQWEQHERMLEARYRSEREALRDRVIKWVREDLAAAEKWLDQGRPEMALSTLRHADEKLQIVTLSANIESETAAEQRLMTLRAPIADAIGAIEGAADNDEALDAVRKHIEDARAALENEAERDDDTESR